MRFSANLIVLLLIVFLWLPKEEGLKLTFSKQAMMPNGSSGEANRKRRKDFEVGASYQGFNLHNYWFLLGILMKMQFSDVETSQIELG